MGPISWKFPIGLFISSVFSKAPERSVSTLSPKLGSLLPGTRTGRRRASCPRRAATHPCAARWVQRASGPRVPDDRGASSAAPTKAAAQAERASIDVGRSHAPARLPLDLRPTRPGAQEKRSGEDEIQATLFTMSFMSPPRLPNHRDLARMTPVPGASIMTMCRRSNKLSLAFFPSRRTGEARLAALAAARELPHQRQIPSLL